MIAGSRHNAAPTAPDNDRLIAQRWIIPFFNRCVKSIAVNMGDREARKLWMA
jgi:hypothetical protein